MASLICLAYSSKSFLAASFCPFKSTLFDWWAASMFFLPSSCAAITPSASVALSMLVSAAAKALSTSPFCLAFSAAVRVGSPSMASLICLAYSSKSFLAASFCPFKSTLFDWWAASIAACPASRAEFMLSAVGALLMFAIASVRAALTAWICSFFSDVVRVASLVIASFVFFATISLK